MSDWLTRSFQQYSVVWLLLSSIIGGIVGATFKFLFESILPQRLTQRREIVAAKRKYSTPILSAADELRRRLQNMISYIHLIEEENWLAASAPNGYYYLSTIYSVARLIGWQQILRNEVVYLDFTTTTETKTFEGFMRAIRRGFSDPDLLGKGKASAPEESQDKWIYTFWLLGIGDAMVIREANMSYTRNYASFVKLFHDKKNDALKGWLQALGLIFSDLKADDIRFQRIVAIHALVNAFIDYADPQHLRTEAQRYHWDLLKDEEADRIRETILSINPKATLSNLEPVSSP